MQGTEEKQNANPLILGGIYHLEYILQTRKCLQQKRKKFNRSASGRRLDSKAPGKFQTGYHIASVETENLTPVGTDRYHQSGRRAAIIKHPKAVPGLARICTVNTRTRGPHTREQTVSASASSQLPHMTLFKSILGRCVSEDAGISLSASFPLPSLACKVAHWICGSFSNSETIYLEFQTQGLPWWSSS